MTDDSRVEPSGPLPPPLATAMTGPMIGPRLVLARYSDQGITALHRVIEENLDHLAPMMRWIADEPKSLIDRLTLRDDWERESSIGRGVTLGIFLDGVLIGSCGLHRRRPVAHLLEIGYWLDRRLEGRGYATETTLLLCEEAFTHDEISEVRIYCDDANQQSAQVAIRAGFHYVATAPSPEGLRSPGESGHERQYALHRSDFDSAWRSRFYDD